MCLAKYNIASEIFDIVTMIIMPTFATQAMVLDGI